MARARGANALAALAFESTYGVPPVSGYFQMPFANSNLGDEQGRIASDLLGLGRDPQRPDQDVVNNRGNVVVPLDARNIGLWLKSLMGAPTTTTGVAATGAYTFSAIPADSAILTVNGVAFTFIPSGVPTSVQALKGSTLADTLANMVVALNASANASITPASYSVNTAGTAIVITHDTIGTAGNSFTIVAGTSPASNATVSAATLAGGSASGNKNHVFVPGGLTLPSYSFEIGNPEVPAFKMNYGAVSDTIQIALQRSGLLNATIGVVAQGELPPTASTGAGTPTSYVVERFSQFAGQMLRDGVPIGDLVSGQVRFGNGLDPVEVIRPDGRISGVDPGQIAAGATLQVRYKDTVFDTLSTSNTPVELRTRWTTASGKSLEFRMPYVDLPKPKQAITGPGGIMASYEVVASKHPTEGRTLVATLVNDVTSY